MKSRSLRLSRDDLRTMVAVLDAPITSFVALAHVAGLDPARDFRGADLRGADFADDDLAGFDFSGADLTGAYLSRATGLHGMITDAGTRFPAQALHPPPDFDLATALDGMLRGEAPPPAWRPFITKLDFS